MIYGKVYARLGGVPVTRWCRRFAALMAVVGGVLLVSGATPSLAARVDADCANTAADAAAIQSFAI